METAPFFADQADGPDGGSAWWQLASDGRRVRVAAWPKADAQGTVLLFPGRTEYVEKYGRAAHDLAARGYATITIDWRGQGLAERVHDDVSMGHVADFDDYQRDVQALLAAARELALPEPYYLIGHSMGGCIGLRALYEGLPVKAAVFSAPMWGILMLGIPEWFKFWLTGALSAMGLGDRRMPGTVGETYVLRQGFEDNLLTRDADMYGYMIAHARHDTGLHLGGPSIRWVHLALHEMRRLLVRRAPDLPCLTFLGTDEKIVDPTAIRSRMSRWPNGRLVMIDGARHEVMMELPEARQQFFDEACALFAANP